MTGYQTLHLDSGYLSQINKRLEHLQHNRFVERVFKKDSSLWDEAINRTSRVANNLGWLDAPMFMQEHLTEITQLGEQVKREGFAQIVILGIGGSTVAREVYLDTFGVKKGFPQVRFLDSTNPDDIVALESSIKIDKSLFVVISKSGHTLETACFFDYFWSKVVSLKQEEAGRHFIAITRDGSALAELSLKLGFRNVIVPPPAVWGRFRALEYAGLLPAWFMGIDISTVLIKSIATLRHYATCSKISDIPGVVLGIALGELYQAGRDKLIIITSSSLRGFGLWIEQLIAESTGKHGIGISPIAHSSETSSYSSCNASNKKYGGDLVFLYLSLEGENTEDEYVAQLGQTGYPVIRRFIHDKMDIGREIIDWAFAIMAATLVIGVDPFEELYFSESLNKTKRLLDEHNLFQANEQIVRYSQTYNRILNQLQSLFDKVDQGDQIVILAYMMDNDINGKFLNEICRYLQVRLCVPVSFQFGPRYLHSVAHLHKGGKNNTLFIQLTADTTIDITIPGRAYTFHFLTLALAQGDFQVLQEYGRRSIAIHFGNEKELKELLVYIFEAVLTRQ